ncbi:MAG: hypothetical protein A3H70_00855 [Candidatus Komeilibacteria bacterium RIFCSPLOWO2_02_FULL_48_11]|uniref:Uncharacterized protein n=1 Tax=Candidatus Komeilibacteria bacterium RIFCSPLOWO2_02_FULL_48_11 TaxID=1798553 RepID=A0A1G2BX19_9BACT|nr:MAG: hypothetical protein A3H70_00855 [Candidatus Komeilibacteria bacterium RIFCSPLOWO2_02_FULL_48_11]
MTEEKWQQLIGQIKDRCQVTSSQKRLGDFEGEEIDVVLFTNQTEESYILDVPIRQRVAKALDAKLKISIN